MDLVIHFAKSFKEIIFGTYIDISHIKNRKEFDQEIENWLITYTVKFE